MLRKKKLELKFVPDKDQEYWHPPKPIEIPPVVDAIAAGTVFVIGSYMLADTLRRCITHAVVTKVV